MSYDPAINSRNASTGAPEEAYKSIASLFIAVPKQKLPKCSSAVEWKNKLRFPLPMECYISSESG